MKNKRPKSFRFYCLVFLCVFVFLSIVLFSCVANDPTGRLFSVMILLIILPGGLSWAQRSAELDVMISKVQVVELLRKDSCFIDKMDLLRMLDNALNEPASTHQDTAQRDSSRL